MVMKSKLSVDVIRTRQAQPCYLPAREHTPGSIGRCALQSLHQELAAYPKPGLVSPIDSGSHRDMDAALFFRSLFSLRMYFRDIALAGIRGAPFAVLKNLGITAEERMLKATRGVNTHRGAIFNLGLLAAAAGHCQRAAQTRKGETLGSVVRTQWGIAIRQHGELLSKQSHGSLMARRHGVGGALQEAAEGFPHVFEVGLPTLQRSVELGADLNSATVQCLFSLIAVLPDTNLLYRGGVPGLDFAQASARAFLDAGGIYQPDWHAQAITIHQQFVMRNLSPGGSADLLAATLFTYRLQRWQTSAAKQRMPGPGLLTTVGKGDR
jgi:triphosphoribosyl-dephospho-CoA synthase